ncbi:MAG: hypothetical protein WB729_24320 [Candidatus Sulfotelmatobacter sp.]
MSSRFLCCLAFFGLLVPLFAFGQAAGLQSSPRNGGDFSDNTNATTKVPKDVILVKGAWSSASDSATPLPEGGSVASNLYTNQYFGLTYPLPADWTEKFKGPPPSDTGRYVLAQLRPADTFKGTARGTILLTAQDMFFTPLPAASATQLVNYSKNHLQADYQVEMQPTPTKIADRPFTFFAYWSPAAQLHWYVLATEIRCHAVEMVLTSRDTKLLENLVLDLNKMKLPLEASPAAGTGGGASPVCIKDYARDENLITRVDPVFSERRFNPVPVRIIIDKEGRVKHIHFLSAFPDQAKAITDALHHWKFKRCLRDGKPVEVETGIFFGRVPFRMAQTASAATE